MFTAKIENQYGELLELTHNANYTVTDIQGLGPVTAVINTAVLATSDGSRFNSSRKGTRNIVITAVIEGEIERNRLALYRYAPPKYPVRFYFKNANRDVFIDGYVESHECSPFESRQLAQISIICPQPFFKSVSDESIEFSSVVPLFQFAFSTNEGEPAAFSEILQNNEQNIYTGGDVETGVIIELKATGTVVNPTIYNRGTGEKFALRMTLQESDVVTINTNTGEKSVTLLRDGVETNILNYASLTNDWFTLRYGDNAFTYEAESGYDFMQLKMIVADKFEGV